MLCSAAADEARGLLDRHPTQRLRRLALRAQLRLTRHLRARALAGGCALRGRSARGVAAVFDRGSELYWQEVSASISSPLLVSPICVLREGKQLTDVLGNSLAVAEIRLALAHLLWAFDVEICAETDAEWPDQRAWFTWKKKALVVRLRSRVG